MLYFVGINMFYPKVKNWWISDAGFSFVALCFVVACSVSFDEIEFYYFEWFWLSNLIRDEYNRRHKIDMLWI